MQLLAHELGHRQWFKFLSSTQRKTWTGDYEDRGSAIKKGHIDYLIKSLETGLPKYKDWTGFTFIDWMMFNFKKYLARISAQQKKHRMRDVLDYIVRHGIYGSSGNVKTLRKKEVEYKVGISMLGGLHNSAKHRRAITEYLNI